MRELQAQTTAEAWMELGLLEALDEEDLRARRRRIAEERYDWKSVAGSLVEAAASMVSPREE